MKETINMWFFV